MSLMLEAESQDPTKLSVVLGPGVRRAGTVSSRLSPSLSEHHTVGVWPVCAVWSSCVLCMCGTCGVGVVCV
jgi:hypothetical protein